MSTEVLTQPAVQDGTGNIGAGDVWSYVSPSRLNVWLKCPLAFRLRYVDGIATPPSTSMFVGKMAHAALEHFYRHRQLGVRVETADVCWRLAESWDEAAAVEGVAFATSDEEQALRRQTADWWSPTLLKCLRMSLAPWLSRPRPKRPWSIPRPARISGFRWLGSWTWRSTSKPGRL